MWKTTGLVLFDVYVGVIHRSSPKTKLVSYAQAFQAQIFFCNKTQSNTGSLSSNADERLHAGWRKSYSNVCLAIEPVIRCLGEIGAKLKSTSPVIIHLTLATVWANPSKTQARGSIRGEQCLTSRKMSSNLHTSGQIGAQCQWLSQHERSAFKTDKRDPPIQNQLPFLFKFLPPKTPWLQSCMCVCPSVPGSVSSPDTSTHSGWGDEWESHEAEND